MSRIAPCKDCDVRHKACHDSCLNYYLFQKENEKIKDFNKKKMFISASYFNRESKRKIRPKRLTKSNGYDY